MGENELSRRSFLAMTLLGCLSISGISFLSSCQKKQGTGRVEAAGDPCTDVSGLTEKERKTRDTYEYVGKSTVTGKYCSNCRLYKEPDSGNPCGTCRIVKGPINPDGYCTAWVAQET